MSIIVNTILLLAFFVFTLDYVKSFRYNFLFVFPIYFSQLWVILSSYYLDLGGIYSFELDMVSTKSYATSCLILANVIFFSIVRYNLSRLNFFSNNNIRLSVPRGFNKLMWDTVMIIVAICSFALLIDMFFTGIPILSETNRAMYADEVLKKPFLGQVYKYYLIMCFFLGILFVKFNGDLKRKSIITAQIVLAYIVTFLQGNKFSAFLDITLLIAIAPVTYGIFEKIKRRQILKVAVLISVAMLLVLYKQSSSYDFIGQGNFTSVFGYIAERFFILQGEIWWKSFDIVVSQNKFDFSHLNEEVRNVVSSTKSYTGLKYLMELTSSGAYIYKLLDAEENQFLFTGASPAIFLVSFGPFLFAFVIAFFGYIFSWLLYFLKKVVVTGNIFFIFIYIIFFQTFIAFYVSGNFDAFFILGNLLRLIIIVFLLFVLYPPKKENGKEACN